MKRSALLLLFIVVIFPEIIKAQALSGTKRIGNGGDYNTISDAITALKINGISGNVVFNILPGTYDEQLDIDFNIAGSSSADTVIFQSSTGKAADVKLQNTSSSKDYILNIDNSRYLSFKNLTFKCEANRKTLIILGDTVNEVNFSNNVFNCAGYNSTILEDNSNKSLVIKNIFIRNNKFINCSYAIYITGSDSNSKEINIQNNSFDNIVGNSIDLSHFNSVTINSNKFINNKEVPVNIETCTGPVNITNNICTKLNGIKAFDLYLCGTTSSQYGLIANNTLESVSSSNGDSPLINIQFSSNLKIYFNSLDIEKSSDNTEPSTFLIYADTSLEIENNIFSNKSGGLCFLQTGSSYNISSDYNDLYTTGKAVISWDGTSYFSLGSFQSFLKSEEQHSFFANPFFASDSDLTPNSGWINNRGDNSILAGILLKDINGRIRNTSTPDIGAIEFTPFYFPLSGPSYTIGSTPSSDFPSLSDAVLLMEKGGITRSITFKYLDGQYDEHVSFGYIPGLSKKNNIVIESLSEDSSKVNLYHASGNLSNYVIKMNGIKYVTFKNLTFTAENNNGKIIDLGDFETDNSFINDRFIEKASGNTNDADVYLSSTGPLDQNLLFDGCSFKGGNKGISITSPSTGASQLLQIKNCSFRNFSSDAILTQDVDGIILYKNTVFNSDTGISIRSCSEQLGIGKNDLFNNGVDLKIADSHIRADKPGLIANNFMESNTGSTAMLLSSCFNVNVYYNSFNSVGTSNNGPTVQVTNGSNTINLINNIFAGDGKVLEIDYPSSASTNSNYNDFFTSYSTVVEYNGQNYSSLKNYQSAVSSDVNSVAVDPGFVSNTNLHGCSDSLSTAGTPSINSVVPYDIDGEMRDNKSPSIGADEFTTSMLIEDFENWTGGNPDNWLTDNYPGQGFIPVTQSTDAYSGNYALKGTAVGISDTTSIQIGIPPIAVSGSNGYGFPFNKRAKSISFYLNYKPVGGDELLIFATLSNGGTQTPHGIALGIYETTETDTGYKKIVVPFHYIDSTSKPENLDIGFMLLGTQMNFPFPIQSPIPGPIVGMLPSDIKFYAPHIGSTFLVDDISADTSCAGGNNSGGVFLPGTNIISFNQPGNDGLLVSGEKETISWSSNNSIITYNLFYTLNEGKRNYLVSNYSGTSYVWKIPENILCRRAKLYIESSKDTTKRTIENVRIKPWELTRVDTAGNYVPYDPVKNGWSFANNETHAWPPARWQDINYQNGTDPYTGKKYPDEHPFDTAKASYFPPWKLFVKVFSVKQCYFKDKYDTLLHYSNRAETIWSARGSNYWGGTCYGFAVTSLLYFYHKYDFLNRYPQFGDYKELSEVNTSKYYQNLIAYFWALQLGKPYTTQRNDNYNKKVVQTLADLKKMFGQDNGDAAPISFYNNGKGGGAHAVTPYKLVRSPAGDYSGKYRLLLYNNNDPDNSDSYNTDYIAIDSNSDSWTDHTGLKWGTGNKHFFLCYGSEKHLTTQVQLKISDVSLSIPKVSLQEPSPVTIYNSSNSQIVVTNSNGGKIGYVNNLVVNNISGGVPIIPLTGRKHPPIGYWLPKGQYSVKMSKNTGTSEYAYFVTDSVIYKYSRTIKDSNGTDVLTFGEGLNIINSDTSVKNINLETIIDQNNSEKTFDIKNIKTMPGDSLRIQSKGMNNLLLQNFGNNKIYNMRIRSVSGNGQFVFVHKAVQLSSNSSELIESGSGSADTNNVKILIDNGNNGTYDDTVVVSDQTTGVKEQYLSSIPDSYKLFQNYPNPFNPTTTIKYQIPKSSIVTLKVYNTLGQLVKTLVNNKKAAGSYSVQFNGSNLSSGVYIYVFQAGTFRSVKKFVLLK